MYVSKRNIAFLLSAFITVSSSLSNSNNIFTASFAGHTDIIQEFLDQGGNPNEIEKGMYGNTLLHKAVLGGQYEVAEALVRGGANINSHNRLGHTPLHSAVNERNIALVEFLLKAGAAVNSNSATGTPLHEAVAKGDLRIVEMLIKAGAQVNAQDINGFTPLHKATSEGDSAMAEALIQAGANPNCCDKALQTPLHSAVSNNDAELVSILIRAKADVNANGQYSYTPLHVAASYGNITIIALLINAGADINKLNKNGFSALAAAIEGNHKDAVKLLVDNGASHAIAAANKVQITPLACAILLGKHEIIDTLLHAGCDPNAECIKFDSKNKLTPLRLIFFRGFIGQPQFFLDYCKDKTLKKPYEPNKDNHAMALALLEGRRQPKYNA